MYRFFDFFEDKSDSYSQKNNPVAIKLPSFLKDTFDLHSHFRDPFLGHTNRMVKPTPTEQVHTLNHKPIIKTIEPKINIPFPEITHLGIVNNTTKGNRTHMIKIEGETYMITSIGNYGCVTVTEIDKNSIKIKFNNEIKSFHP